MDGAGASSPLLIVDLETRITENMTWVVRAHTWHRVPPSLDLFFKGTVTEPGTFRGREKRERGRKRSACMREEEMNVGR